MFKMLQKLTKNLIYAIPAMMLAGFVYGLWADTGWLKAAIVPFTFLMVYPMMVTLKIRKVFEGGDAKAQILTQLINFGLTPFLAFGVGLLFFRDNPYMALGLLLAGLVPTSGMTISWTGFAKGNMSAAVKMTVIGLIAGSLATPLYVQALMGTAIEMQISAVFKQILFIVFLPMALGYLTQRFLVKRYGQERFQRELGPKFPGLSTVGVLGIVFVALALKAKTIAAAPGVLLDILVPLVLLYGVNFLISTFVGRSLLPRGDAIALVYGSVMRNLSIALAIAINAFGAQGSDAALVIAMAYIIQVQSAAWYVRFTHKVFGLPEELAQPA
ncbi:bile acid:sodium symporter [Pseudodesulfovibrio thermohalotolerans]|jgi:ACR3 family arsenite efflux pump ArsB|uniref:arsenic resistance protein n=1 Tax=Pseudodesulfovibrio thermohalotolerans TaxID=2880651 RepID=UPI0024415BA8|nr:bile acid:sodium symporter [Pseudodesulfovibrio thermohalotolerans]WFS62283.1 bile acid:sodium symporter [Pseudodesulfovibrio thermohalotolerans]